MLDGDDRVWKTKDAVRVLTSVVPLSRDGRAYVLFAHVVAFARDFGPPGPARFIAKGHSGDTEAFGMAFSVDGKGGLRWAASVAKGHPCTTCKGAWHWHGQDFDADGAPLVYVEEDKHGLWQNRSACEHEAGFDCESDRALRPAAVNTGNAQPDGATTLVDVLDDVDPEGPHAPVARSFPGETVYSAGRAAVPGRFCGGRHRSCTKKKSAKLPGDVLAAVLERFARDAW
jgi:hypothetical protein